MSFWSWSIASFLFSLHFLLVIGSPVKDHIAQDDTNNTVVYQLFTRKNPTEYQMLKLNDLGTLLNSNYDSNLLVKFYAIGWDNDGSIAYPTKDEYLLREDCNFIVVDWKSIQDEHKSAVIITTEAGQHAGAFLNFLIENGTPVSAFHLIGHSAGVHLAGIAGAAVTAGKIPRITGLDPAAGWDLNDTDTRLDVTDADFVDIIHTNGGKIYEAEVAWFYAIGHIDFYVNGGHHQPGCPKYEFGCCSHCRSADLFAESINSKIGFLSLRCDSFEEFKKGICDGNDTEFMGENIPASARGIFQVTTNEEAPWARG